MAGATHPAPGEAFNQKRSDSANAERHADRKRPWHAGMQRTPNAHAADHEQTGDAEIEKFQDADAQRQRHRYHGIDRAEHQAVDDLLREHGVLLRGQKIFARSYCTGQREPRALSVLAACRGQLGFHSNMRPSTTRSARPFATISSAISADAISPTAAVAMPTSLRTVSANGT